MERFRSKPCPGLREGLRERVRVGGPDGTHGPSADAPAGECGVKDQVSRAGAPFTDGPCHGSQMDLTFTGRGLPVSDDIREQAEHKLARLERLEPRVTRIDLEFLAEHHPSPDGLKMIKAALKIPRKTFRARAEADDVRTALDHVAEKLERQIRDHHGKRLRRWRRGVPFPRGSTPPPADADE
jgi:ribosomal subunit interface protein